MDSEGQTLPVETKETPLPVSVDKGMPFPAGSLICAGRYRLVSLLSQRPRVHLYLAQRLSDGPLPTNELPLVAIRELVLSNLDAEARQQVVHAAQEEFAAPQLFGSSHVIGVGDRLYLENERIYLVMQPRPAAGKRPVIAVPLSEVLADPGPAWLDLPTALHWGLQLCLVAARLHRQHNVLGELTPETLLVGRDGKADWAPLLLANWPPAPRFWPCSEAQAVFARIFPPLAEDTEETDDARSEQQPRPFAAPEYLAGKGDERSDVYTLGAILTFLLTRSLPAATSPQTHSDPEHQPSSSRRDKARRRQRRHEHAQNARGSDLDAPHILNKGLPPGLEDILLSALALDPQKRFVSIQALVDALTQVAQRAEPALPEEKAPRLRRLLRWFHKE